jgi:hypothetical protein
MGLEQLNRSVDFVADSPPSNANDGELFLDTSLSPPQVKVFDASVGSFVRPQTAQNLDQPVSNAGATQSEITAGVNAADTGIDWASKTPQVDSPAGRVSVTGSGYLIGISVNNAGRTFSVDIDIDGNVIQSDLTVFDNPDGAASSIPLFHRFGSSFEVNPTDTGVIVTYVLD